MNVVEMLRRNIGLTVVVASATIYLVASLWFTRNGVPLPPDSLEYAEVARNLAHGAGYTINLIEIHPGLLPTVRHLHELHGLLQPIWLAPLFALLGPHGALVRVPGLFFVASLAIATFFLGKRVFGSETGCLAGLLVLGRQDLAFDGTLGGDDVGWAFFSTLAVLFFFRWLEAFELRWAVLAGCAAALATLQKVSGVALPACFVVVVLLTGACRVAGRVRALAAMTLPVVAALALYAVRNHALHGGFGFRQSGLEWLFKESPLAYFAYYDRPPSLSDVFARLGVGRVLGLAKDQFTLLLTATLGDPLALIAGPAALVWLARTRNMPFAVFGAIYTLVVGFVVCVIHHVEPRYLFGLFPIYFVAVSAAAVELWRFGKSKLHAAWPRRISCLAVGACGVVLVGCLVGVLRLEKRLGRIPLTGPCDSAIDYIRETVGTDEPVLTSSPWFLTWVTGHPSVMVPTNGRAALTRVALHYHAAWAVDGMPTLGGPDVGEMLRAMNENGVIRADRVFEGAACNVYRLTPR
jgi:hypothetical protein